MNVTMRTNSPPDIYIQSTGQACNLANLDRILRSLRTARRWLVEEQKRRQAGEPARERPTVQVAK